MTTPIVPSISDEQLAELEAAAKAATPGPYRQCGADSEFKACSCGQIWSRETDELVAFAHAGDEMVGAPSAGQAANSQFFASASPTTIQGLIARLRAAEADAKRYRWLAASSWYAGPQPTDEENGYRSNDENWNTGRLSTAIDAAMERTP